MHWKTSQQRILAACAGLATAAALVAPQPAPLAADEPQPAPAARAAADPDQQAVASLLQRYCFDCHGPQTQEANLRLDRLDLALEQPSDREMLQSVVNALRSGEMPPADVEGPAADERELIAVWAAKRLGELAEQARRSGNWTQNRRLTAEQYNYTLQSLFGVDAEFADGLPPDPISTTGFQNDSELLGLSALQMECYLDSARRAVQRYVTFGSEEEPAIRYHVAFKDLYYTTADRYETRQRAPQPVDLETFTARRAATLASAPRYVAPLSPLPPGGFPPEEELRAAVPKLHQQFLALPQCPSKGEMLVRIRAAATPDRDGRYPRMRLDAGITLGDGDWMNTRLVGEVDVTAPPENPAVYSFRMRVEDVPTKGPLRDEDAYDQLSVFDMVQVFIANVSRDDQAIYALGRGGLKESEAASSRVSEPLKQMADAGVNFLYLDSIEIEMLPALTASGHSRWSVDLHGASSQEQREIAAEVLQRFMRQAYRRPITAAEVNQKLQLYDTLQDQGYDGQESLRETMAAVLVAPPFLFLESGSPNAREQATGPTSHQLAARLSYLLWLAPPDERLMELADSGTLLEPGVLADQAERLLDDPRSRRFLDSFCRQWLRLDKFANVAVDAHHHPQYDSDLAKLTTEETLHTFAELFRSNSSMLELLDCDYVFLNDRLADHYDLEPVLSGDLQKVQLPAGSVRGGLLTQASLLTMNSDGVDSHPIRRGVWLLQRLLNAPPPPPPPNVPGINEADPDFRGLSLKQRIELHRSPGACQSCHQKIDPWGIALENFDATGRWREQVRTTEDGKQTSQPVDAAAELPDGQRIDGIDGLKHHLSQQRSEQFTRALVHHLLTYGRGRPLDYADQQDIETIHQRFAAAEYRPRDLVRAIVEHESFAR